MSSVRVHDITQGVGPATAVWPGDQPVELSWTLRRDRGDSVNVAATRMSVHAGTHVDGPLHVSDEALAASSLPLESFLGRVEVVDARGRSSLGPELLNGLEMRKVERVLFRTRDAIDRSKFPESFAAISVELAQALSNAGVLLVGTDAPSVDPVDSKTLDAHHVLMRGGVTVIENLMLTDIKPGRYTLIALPLKLEESDSAPVRAILIEGAAELLFGEKKE